MNANAHDIAVALVELSKASPSGQKLLRDIRSELNKHIQDEGALDVVLVTPSGSEPQLASAVSVLITKNLGREARVTERANPELIGGAVVQIGDQQIDLSVRGALNDLASKLSS